MKIYTIIIACLYSLSVIANDEGAFLNEPFKNLVHPKKSHRQNSLLKFTKSNTLFIIQNQSPVKAQKKRGTCSMFSTTAYVEGALITKKLLDQNIDLSEEWLEFTSLNGAPSDGSSAANNFSAVINYGMSTEETMPYLAEDWFDIEGQLQEMRCGHLTGNQKISCRIIHRDSSLINMPDEKILSDFNDQDFVTARKEASDFKEKYLRDLKIQRYYIPEVDQVKDVLIKGEPVVLEVDFYYGAWNHARATELGIERDLGLWAKGIITAPEKNSVDVIESNKKSSGHSVLVVGFDDNKIIKRSIKMADGTMKEFTYKGVYYFKNSWGTDNFAKDSNIDGVATPGYGMIVQKYAEDDGAFYRLPGLYK